jgi:tetratricopeptide (TPR) repeat protein
MAESERMQKLLLMLEKSPGDTFLLYAVAMEHKKAGDMVRAVDAFDRVIQLDWGYLYAYHQKGLALEAVGNVEAAKAAYRTGMDAATRKGDAHAREEIGAALSMIE